MLTSDFEYELPDDRIAQHPGPRGKSRLLVLDRSGQTRHQAIEDLPRLLEPGDLLVVNNTKVLPARLFARRQDTGGRVEILLVERIAATDWTCLLRPSRRVREGTRLTLGTDLVAEITSKEGNGKHRIRFDEPIEPHFDQLGHVPLPPYIKRADLPKDREAYQTVYASVEGAVAAPTAGLHLTLELLTELEAAGIGVAELTLHVGIGTFKPVTAELVHEHRMDPERFEVPEATARALVETQNRGGRVIAVGTTVVRALETLARRDGGIQAVQGTTDLFATPGFEFQVIHRLLTNFHLPRSTLLMLVCAFAGREKVLKVYRQAVDAGYRFYSYGDAMLIERG